MQKCPDNDGACKAKCGGSSMYAEKTVNGKKIYSCTCLDPFSVCTQDSQGEDKPGPDVPVVPVVPVVTTKLSPLATAFLWIMVVFMIGVLIWFTFGVNSNTLPRNKYIAFGLGLILLVPIILIAYRI